MLVIVDEADKPDVGQKVIEVGLASGDTIPGLVGLEQLAEDYELWNRGEFPGVEEAMSQVRADEDGILRPTEDGLDKRWVRRRLGAVPDSGTEAVRPFYADDVARAEQRWTDEHVAPDYDAFGVDIARGGGDRTVVVGVTNEHANILENVEAPGNHRRNKRLIQDALDDTGAPVVIDAVGEGSGVADELDREYSVTRFNGGANAREPEKYYNLRAEALGYVGGIDDVRLWTAARKSDGWIFEYYNEDLIEAGATLDGIGGYLRFDDFANPDDIAIDGVAQEANGSESTVTGTEFQNATGQLEKVQYALGSGDTITPDFDISGRIDTELIRTQRASRSNRRSL